MGETYGIVVAEVVGTGVADTGGYVSMLVIDQLFIVGGRRVCTRCPELDRGDTAALSCPTADDVLKDLMDE